MHITITGMLGSGKSTVCNIISQQHGFEIYSTGKIQRQAALELNVSTLELNKMMKERPELDDIIDSTTVKLSKENKHKDILFDSRMAWHFVEDSFKIFLSVDPMEAAIRVTRSARGNEESYVDEHEAMAKLMERAESEHERFIRIYNADYWNYLNYDLVIDTTWLDADTIANLIILYLEEYKKTRQKNDKNKAIKELKELKEIKEINKETNKANDSIILVSPKSLYPSYISSGKSEGFVRKADYERKNIQIINKNQYNHIIKGHATVLQAIQNQTQLVRVRCLAKQDELDVRMDSRLLELFQQAGGFSYKSYPVTTSQ